MYRMNDLDGHAARWHRPMMGFAALMAVMVLVCTGGLLFDDRILTGEPIWSKPFKFAISMLLYCVTWAWMVSLLTRWRRVAERVSTVIVTVLGVEYAIMVAQVIRGETSHFNISSALNTTLWAIMGISIAVLWTGTLVLTVMLVRTPVKDAANRWAIRLGALLSLAGLALGTLMVTPTDAQLNAPKGSALADIAGAHSVGVVDGGPTMPITGWSTTGGDLRIPHFVGMHALQLLPVLAIVLGALATRVPRLRAEGTRMRLVVVGAAGYAGLVALVTWQALRGQSLIHPDAVTVAVAAALVMAVAAGALWALGLGHEASQREPAAERAEIGR